MYEIESQDNMSMSKTVKMAGKMLLNAITQILMTMLRVLLSSSNLVNRLLMALVLCCHCLITMIYNLTVITKHFFHHYSLFYYYNLMRTLLIALGDVWFGK